MDRNADLVGLAFADLDSDGGLKGELMILIAGVREELGEEIAVAKGR